MGNGAIDAGILTEPFVAQLVRTGVARALEGRRRDLPGHQITALLYGPDFAARQEAADPLPGGLRARRPGIQCAHQQQRPHAAYEILPQHTPIKDINIYPPCRPSNIDPDGEAERGVACAPTRTCGQPRASSSSPPTSPRPSTCSTSRPPCSASVPRARIGRDHTASRTGAGRFGAPVRATTRRRTVGGPRLSAAFVEASRCACSKGTMALT